MTIIRINAIEVAEGKGPAARRFAGRAHAVDAADGFEGFELLQPTDGRRTWLVVTRWRDAAAFESWVASPAFGHGHRGAESDRAAAAGAMQGTETPADAPQGTEAPAAAAEPITVASELWSYEAVDLNHG